MPDLAQEVIPQVLKGEEEEAEEVKKIPINIRGRRKTKSVERVQYLVPTNG